MNLRQVADLAVARMGMPVPMAKLVTMQAIGEALARAETSLAFAQSLADWASTRELESECLEALCPLLVASPSQEVVALIRKAINRPSLASDALLSIATGSPSLLASWSGCHSGPAQRFDDVRDELTELRAGTFIPPIFTNQLQKLQTHTGHPFLKQWAFEYRKLRSHFGRNGDGFVDYFRGSDRQTGGQFVARKGHLARSAFLRTLAFAADHWEMPMELASSVAEVAYPAEAIFLRFPPNPAPAWAAGVHSREAAEAQDAPTLAKTLIEAIEAETHGRLMHCSLAVVDEPKVRVDFEVFSIAQAVPDLDTKDVFRFYEYLVGKVCPARDALRAFLLSDMDFNGDLGIGFAPLMLPLVSHRVGYLQADLLGRVPYVPVSSPGLPNLELVPTADQAVFRSNGRDVGSWAWWCWNWQPTHPRDQPPLVASSVTLTPDSALALVNHLGDKIEQVWRITKWTRDRDYGEWTESEIVGRYQAT